MFKLECEKSIERKFISEWENDINDQNKYPSLRTYRIFKTKLEMEPYLYLVKNPKYRMAISKFRSSSHILEIERGRHTRPITPLENRLCSSCKVVETEIHFLLEYRMAISKFRSSSHILEIERGRHTRPITPLENRLCSSCKVVETEIHFLLECPMYQCYRGKLFNKVLSVEPYLNDLLPVNKFTYLMTSSNEQVLKWVGKFVYLAFNKRLI